MDFWDLLWLFFWTYAIIAYLTLIFWILADLFRDHELSGWAKAAWMLFLVFVPFVTALIYLVSRGSSMQERRAMRSAP